MIIKVRAIPNAKHDEIVNRIGTILRVRVAAPAVDGKANERLCCFLAEYFGVKRRMVYLRKGEKGREKTIEIVGRSEEDLYQVLEMIP